MTYKNGSRDSSHPTASSPNVIPMRKDSSGKRRTAAGGSAGNRRRRNTSGENKYTSGTERLKAAARRRGLWVIPSGGRSALRGGQDYYDYNLLAAVILLTCFGLVMLYSTSAYEASVEHGSDTFYFGKQAAISAVCIVGMLAGSMLDYHKYIKLSPALYALSMLLLVATRFIGREVNGAKRWIYIGPLHFQPAEVAKLAIILYLPYLVVKSGNKFRGVKEPLRIAAYGILSAGFTYFFTDNLSTGLIIAGITVLLIFIVHPSTRKFAVLLLGAGVAAVALIAIVVSNIDINSDSFRLRRILVWRNPERYQSVRGYQVMQGLYAIGSGGFFGKGLGNSTQKLGALPEAQNDMIFSIICEELGLFGAILVIALFIFLLYRLFFIAQNAPDLAGSMIAAGIFIHIALQVILNIAVVTNLIPTTGITLPFISYGGTSIVFLMAEMMVALSISRQIQFR